MTAADIIATIDEVTAPQCGWCNKPLRADGPSDYFCNEQHQTAWRDGTIAPQPEWITSEPLRLQGGSVFARPSEETLTWRPPDEVVEVRMDRPVYDELWRGCELVPIAVGHTRWFLRGADGHEVQVPQEVVDEATPLEFTRPVGLSEQAGVQECLRQLAQQFAEAADRIRARRLPL